MKPSFSFRDALNAPFVLIRRRPLTVFVWGVLMTVLIGALYAVFLPVFANVPLGDDAAASQAYMSQMMAMSAASNGLSLLMYLVMLVVFNAAGRATLAPGTRDRFLFMRLGMDEVRVAVTIVAIFIGWYVALIILIVIGVVLGIALWPVSEFAAVISVLLYGLAVVILALLGWARVCLIAPATLVLGRFAFEEGWTIAKGQVLKLVGLNLAIWLIYMLAYIVLAAIVALILIGGFMGQGLSWPEHIDRLQDLMPVVRPMLIPLAATVPIFTFAYGAYIALVAAPFVRTARQLLDGAPVNPVTRTDVGREPDDTLHTV